jgi:hypothetical protein
MGTLNAGNRGEKFIQNSVSILGCKTPFGRRKDIRTEGCGLIFTRTISSGRMLTAVMNSPDSLNQGMYSLQAYE